MIKSFVLKSIKLENFRNYSLHSQNFTNGINKIIGPNATGKTNIIEAIALITQISSFKHTLNADLIKHGQNSARIEAEIYDKAIDEQYKIELSISKSKKSYKINSKNKTNKECRGLFPSVVFTPDDLFMIKGANNLRRYAIDNLGLQISKDYYKVWKDYSKILKQKNTLLKTNTSIDLLKSINDVMVIAGAQLMYYRSSLINKLLPIIKDYYNEIAGNKENLNIEYFASWDETSFFTIKNRDKIRRSLADILNKNLNKEQALAKCLIGPHKDKIIYYINDSNAQKFASQGQQRSIVLAYKMSEVKMIENILKIKPILLLDDVLSELDNSRQQQFLNFIKSKTQSFITSIN